MARTLGCGKSANVSTRSKHYVNIVYELPRTSRQARSEVMATRKQKQWAGRGPVISVRVEPELAERLDALAARTRRSRGTYLRMALWAALPQLEKIHWEQVAADYERLAIKDAFEEITLGFMEQALQEDRERDNKD